MGARPSVDLVLKGGRVIDPSQSFDAIADIAIRDGVIVGIGPNLDTTNAYRMIDVSGLLVTPGLIDLHLHCNSYSDPEALDADQAGIRTGVTRLVDPGDAGAYNFQAFRKHVVEKSQTRVHAWLSAAALGGVVFGLNNTTWMLHPHLIDVDTAVQTIKAFPEIIRGVKSYFVPEAWGTWDGQREVYRKMLEIAEQAECPLYIHTGSFSQTIGGYDWHLWIDKQPPPATPVDIDRALEDGLTMLRPGDIVTHMFSTLAGSVWNYKQSRLSGGVREAYDKGVYFDSGFGSHFNFRTISHLLESGIVPHTLSTDRHANDELVGHDRRSNRGLCLLMSQMMAMGLSLTDVIRMTTSNPAKVLRLGDRAGTIRVGMPAEITVLCEREGRWTFSDAGSAYGEQPNTMEGRTLLVPDDQVHPINPAFLPQLDELELWEPVWRWRVQKPA
jgi:dihydroorotase